MSPGGAPAERGSPRRPLVARALAIWLGALPVLQLLSLAGLRLGAFAPDRPWSFVAYGLAAPYVAWLVWHRRPRARFAAYVFLTHEAARGAHLDEWGAAALGALWVLLLQLPAARRWLPPVRAAEMRARWRSRRVSRAPGAPDPREPRAPAPGAPPAP